MSNPGIQIQQPDAAVQPKLPGVINVPAAVSTAPTVPPSAQGNNTGNNQAQFNSSADPIQALLQAKTAELQSGMQAIKANASVDASASTQMSGLQTDTLAAYHNIEKAAGLPGGADGKLAKIISLFDSDYNAPLQQIKVQENQLRSNQISATAAALKEQNNALPALMGKMSAAEQAIFNAQLEQNKLVVQQGTLADQQLKTKIDFARLGIEKGKDARDAAEFPWRLKQAQMNVGLAQQSLAKGDREAYNDSMTDAMSHLPVDRLQPALNAAQSSGSPFVSFPTGQIDPKTKKPVTLDVPIPIVQAGIAKNAAIEQQADTALAADMTQKMNIIPNVKSLISAGNAFALVDPTGATGVVNQTASILSAMQPNNPANVRQIGMLINQQQERMKAIGANYAAQLASPEAKAAVTRYAAGTPFDAVGGTALIGDVLGTPGLSTNTHFSKAFSTLNTLVATKIRQQDVQGAGSIDPTKSADVQSMFAQLMMKPSGREKIKQISQEVIADPANQKAITQSITGKIQGDALKFTLEGYAKQKNANPVWQEIIDHPDQFNDPKTGQPDPGKMFDMFERLNIQAKASGSNIDFSQAFLKGLVAYGQSTDNATNDPTYTIHDQALLGAMYNSSPHRNIVGDLHWQLRQLADRAHKEMQDRIQQDVGGQTQRQALTQSGFENFNMDPSVTATNPMFYDKIYNKTGLNLATVPSATGTSLTAEQVKKLYSGGN